MKSWTKREVAAALRRWARENGRQPTHNAWRKTPPGMPPRSAIEKHFGSWRAAMAACGFEERGRGERPRTHRENDDCSNASCDRAQGRQGSLGRCRRCEYFWRRYGEEWADRTEERRAEVCELIRELVAEGGGRIPSYRQFVEEARETIGVARRPDTLFGTWGAAVEAAGFERPNRGRPSISRLAAN